MASKYDPPLTGMSNKNLLEPEHSIAIEFVLSDCDCCHNSMNMWPLLQKCFLGFLLTSNLLTLVHLIAVNWSGSVSVKLLEYSPPLLQKHPQCRETEYIYTSSFGLVKHIWKWRQSTDSYFSFLWHWRCHQMTSIFALFDIAAFCYLFEYRHPFSSLTAIRRVMLTMAILTKHHHAGFVIESGVVGIHECLLQFFGIDVATTIWIHCTKPLVGLRVHTGGNVTCNIKTDYIRECKCISSCSIDSISSKQIIYP